VARSSIARSCVVRTLLLPHHSRLALTSFSEPPVLEATFDIFFHSRPGSASHRVHPFNGNLHVDVYSTHGVTLGHLMTAFRTTAKAKYGVTDAEVDNYAISVATSNIWMRRRVFASAEEVASVQSGMYKASNAEVGEVKRAIRKIQAEGG